MKQTENMIQALLSIDKNAMKARKQGGLGTPTIPVYVLAGEKLKQSTLENFCKRANIQSMAGEPLVLAGNLLDGKSPTGFLFTTVGVYPSKDILTARQGKNPSPVAYRDLETVLQNKKTGNSHCILRYRNGDEIEVFGNIYCCWFTEAVCRLLPLAKDAPEEKMEPKSEPVEISTEDDASDVINRILKAPAGMSSLEMLDYAVSGKVSEKKAEAPKPAPVKPTPKPEPKPEPVKPEAAPAGPRRYMGEDSYTPEQLCSYALDFLKAGQREEAAELYRCAVAQGSAEACFSLGMLYLDHQLPEDHTYDLHRAHGLVLEAASKGHPAAKALAREIYFVPEDFYHGTVEEQWKNYGIKGKKTHLDALNVLKQGNISEGVKLLEQSAEFGWEPAMYLLGRLHLCGKYDFCNPMVGSALLHRCGIRGNTAAVDVLLAVFPEAKVISVTKPKPPKPSQAQEDLYLMAQAWEETDPELADELYKAICERHSGANYVLAQKALSQQSFEVLRYMQQGIVLDSEEIRGMWITMLQVALSQHEDMVWNLLELAEEYLGNSEDALNLWRLAKLLLEGREGVPNYEKGICYLRRAMDLEPMCYALMAERYQEEWLDPSERKQRQLFWLERGANADSSLCMVLLAQYYGQPGPNQDPEWSCFWAKKCWAKAATDEEKRVASYYLSLHSKTQSERSQWKEVYRSLKE